jgi:hypothetical protein
MTLTGIWRSITYVSRWLPLPVILLSDIQTSMLEKRTSNEHEIFWETRWILYDLH